MNAIVTMKDIEPTYFLREEVIVKVKIHNNHILTLYGKQVLRSH